MLRRLSDIACLVLLVLLLVVPPLSWVLAAFGMEVGNLLTAEGFRWICMHAMENLAPHYILWVLAFVIALGCVEESGLYRVLHRHRTINQRLGLLAACVVFLLLVMPVVVPVFKVGSALRGVTGSLVPSPWLSGLPFALSSVVFFTTLAYALYTSKERIWTLVARLLTAGISHYAILLIDLSMLSFLLSMLRFVLVG